MFGTKSLNEIFAVFPLIPLFLAFAIPAAFRAVPEILAGPFPLGFDTITWYAPLMAVAQTEGLGAAFEVIVESQRAPLFSVISVLLAAAIPVHPFAILKVLGPVLLGAFSLSVYVLARDVFVSRRMLALFVAIFVALYFATLRLSWDLFRNLLGYLFFILALHQLLIREEKRSDVLLALFATLTFLSHELVLILLLAVLSASSVRTWFRTRRVPLLHLSLLTLGIVLLLYYAHWLVPPGGQAGLGIFPVEPIGLWTNYLEIDGFFGYGSLGELNLTVLLLVAVVLLPLIPLILRRESFRGLVGLWLVFLLLVGLSPLILPMFAAPVWYRWILMAAVPLTIIAAVRISALPPRTVAAALVGLLVTASLYSFLAAESAAPVFASPLTVRYLPSSMLQNTGPLQDSQATVEALEWLSENAPPGSLLLAHYAFTGWALLFANNIEIQTYFSMSELDLDEYQDRPSVYTIWWIEDVGWYPSEIIDSRFETLHAVGRVGILGLG